MNSPSRLKNRATVFTLKDSTFEASKFKKNLPLFLIYISGIFLFALVLFFTHRIPGDDLVFPNQIKPYASVFDWVSYRYQSWSGRIFSESFVYIFSILPVLFWKITSLIFYATFSFYLFLYYRAFAKYHDPTKDRVMMTFALVLPLLLDPHALSDGMIWITGSMNYFWPTALALIGFYPFLYLSIRKKLPQWLFCAFGFVASIVAACSQEQVGLILVTAVLVFCVYIFIHGSRAKTTRMFILLQTLMTVFSFIISVIAPGNKARVASEAAARLPDFYRTPLAEHAEYAYRWFIDSTINHLGLVLAINWLLLVILFIHKKNTKAVSPLDYTAFCILFISTLFVSFKGFGGVSYLFNFYPTWKPHAPTISLILLIPWTISLLTTVLSPVILFGKKSVGLVVSLLYAVAFASIFIIVLSPSIYASGVRVLYAPSIFIVLIGYYYFEKVFEKYRYTGFIIVSAALCLAVFQYLYILGRTFR